MSLTNIEVTIDDREWPEMHLTVKAGQQVQRSVALFDVANTKFAPVVNNAVSQAIDAHIRRRKQGHGNVPA